MNDGGLNSHENDKLHCTKNEVLIFSENFIFCAVLRGTGENRFKETKFSRA